MAKVLVCTFGCADGSKWSITLKDPKAALTKVAVDAAMNTVISKDIFTSNPTSIIGAEYREVIETAIS